MFNGLKFITFNNSMNFIEVICLKTLDGILCYIKTGELNLTFVRRI
jgi:hypothetical protein